jgi:hypothetical protein
MSAIECPREQDVLDEIEAGRWPELAPEDLRAHAAACAACRDFVDVVPLLREAGQASCDEVTPPSAGQVWWRAELRAKNEAARAAQRPMTIAQAIAAACTIAVLLALVSIATPTLLGWLGRLSGAVQVPGVDLAAVTGFVGQWRGVVALALGVWLVLAPVAIYLMVRDDRA